MKIFGKKEEAPELMAMSAEELEAAKAVRAQEDALRVSREKMKELQNIKRAKKPEEMPKKVLVKSDYLIKELPLFKYEHFILLGATFAGLALYFLDNWGIIEGATRTGLIAVVLTAWGLWLIKTVLYMPRGDKIIVQRCLESSGVHLSVEKLPKDYAIHYDKNDDNPPTQITRLNKHFDLSTGRPWIIAAQNHSENISIQDLLTDKMDKKSAKELNAIVKNTWATAWQAATANLLKFQSKLKDVTQYVTILLLVGIIIIAFLQWSMNGQLVELTGDIKTIAETLPTLVQLG